MAKGKHAAALFEVIHNSGKRYEKSTDSTGALRTPRWWFKGRTDTPAAPSADPSCPAPTTNPPSQSPLSQPPRSVHPASALETAANRLAVKVDPDRHQIFFRLTYTNAIIGAFAILVIIGLAFIVGSKGQAPKYGPPTEQIKAGPVDSSALEVGPDATPVTNPPAPTGGGEHRTWTEPRATTPLVVKGGNRTVGLNYVVIQSYPTEKDAIEARDLLIKCGVGCTVEKGLPFAPKWFSVVGTEGHDKLRGNKEYESYIKKIQSISDKFAGSSKFKKFLPQAYKWK